MRCLFSLLAFVTFPLAATAVAGDLYTDPADPYYVGRDYPKLTTPQWVGEEGVKAVVTLGIDDMRDPANYEAYLRPILERLKQIDGRAPVSIMTVRVDPNDPRLQGWLKEGLSIETHTFDHPCPLLAEGDFAKAKTTYEKCVDLMATIPGSKAVAFRVPCCDSLNTPSPRFYQEIFNKVTEKGNFLQIDSSVFNITTSQDPQLPKEITLDAQGKERFRRYVPFESFVNTIEDYPYPYLIAGLCWQFPCVAPSDWSAQHVQGVNNPATVEDWKLLLDAAVIKEGTFNLVFHPHGWIEAAQVVELIDHAVAKHGKAVKFLTFAECLDRLNKNLLDGHSVRDEKGQDDGVRLVDINKDGFIDVTIDSPAKAQVRVWSPEKGQWTTQEAPGQDDQAAAAPALPEDLEVERPIVPGTARLVDLDDDGYQDLIYSDAKQYAVYLFDPNAKQWGEAVVKGVRGEKPATEEIPPFMRADGTNNGAWFHSRHIWWQNEDTAGMPNLVDRRSFDWILRDVQPGPRPPEVALRSMRPRRGFEVELVAAEPLVMDPIYMDWGADGKLWIVEMGDYPRGVDGKGAPGGVVRFLEDTDEDGKYDKSTVFLENLPFPTGLRPWRKGVIVTAAPDIFYAEDTNGDGKADKREVLFSGFGEGNQQHRVNGLVYGLDNWFYGANGHSGGNIKSAKTGETVELGGNRDFRLRPDEGIIEPESGVSQFGRTRDDWGNWFGCDNSNPNFHYVLPDHYLRRNPHAAVNVGARSYVPEVGGPAPIFPVARIPTRFNEPQSVSRITSANSICIYRDDLFGPEYAGNSFVSEPVHNLIHREIMRPEGVTFRSRRADDEQTSEFLASTDPWFRPTGLKTGPDGALWVADMYRHVIEHPEWIPQEWQQRLDLRAGHDKGRIYRFYPTGKKPRAIPRLDKLDAAGLVAALDSPNGWQRDMAQQLLVERQDKAAVAPLRQMARENENPLARLHALCTLDGLGALDVELVKTALADKHPGVVRHAVRLSEPFLNTEPQLVKLLASHLNNDEEPAVRLQVAFSLGESKQSGQLLAQAALKWSNDPYFMAAALSSVNSDNLATVLETVMASGDEVPPALLESLLRISNATGDGAATALVLNSIAGGEPSPEQLEALSRILDTLDATGTSLSTLAAEGDDATKAAAKRLAPAFALARKLVADPEAPEEQRAIAVRLLGRGPDRRDEDMKTLAAMLSPQAPDALRSAAIDTLGRSGSDQALQLLLTGWRGLGPAQRGQVLDHLLNRNDWTLALLDAMEQEKIRPTELDAPRRQRLLQHKDEALRERAAKAFVDVIKPDRQAVIEAFAPALDLEGDVSRGQVVFTKICATCHKLGDVGNAVGPDLAGLSDKSSEYQMTHILDPNRAIEGKYVNYVVETKAGQTLTGILSAETGNSITLVTADGKENVILRTDLKLLRGTGISLMPEGLETGLAPQDLADLMEFVRGSAPPPQRKEFPGNDPVVIRPAPEGSLRLLASNAEIYGPNIVLEEKYGNIGFWSGDENYLVWVVEPARPGKYTVWLEWACDDSTAGNTFRVQTGTSKVVAKVPGTGTWDNYQRDKFGEVTLRLGRQRVIFRSDGPVNGSLIDLKSVELIPVR